MKPDPLDAARKHVADVDANRPKEVTVTMTEHQADLLLCVLGVSLPSGMDGADLYSLSQDICEKLGYLNWSHWRGQNRDLEIPTVIYSRKDD